MLVSFSGRPFGFVDEALALLGRERRIVLTVNQFFTAGKVVANSNLLTVLPRHFVNVTGMADELVMRDLPYPVPTVQVVWDATGQFRNQVTNLLYFAGRGAAGGATHISINNATFVDYNPAIHTAPDGSGPRM